jgi:formylglycine-generating enzyme required for sulfatase activity
MLVQGAVLLALAGFPLLEAGAGSTPPTGSIVINGNRSTTKLTSVTLTLDWNDADGKSDVVRMRFSNDGANWSAWETLAATKPYSLPPGDGYKTVRVQFLDRANNRSITYSDYIRLDTTAPTGGIVINGGASTTITRSVTLTLNWADTGAGVTRMRFSDNGSTWTPWEPQKTPRAHTLPEGLGYHTVRVQYTDGADNYSPVYNDYIKLIEDPANTQTVMLSPDVPLVMKWVPGGTFTMGAGVTEESSFPMEFPRHSVTLPGFWMAKYELTKRQWTAVMGTTPWDGETKELPPNPESPAVMVSSADAHAFLTAVNTYTGKTFRLPSESEWEYACRGGMTTRYYWGDDPDNTAIGDYAWYRDNCLAEPYAHVVGMKLPNAFGLYDINGNVDEWCEDDYHTDYTGAPTDGTAWVDVPRGAWRVCRGGHWNGFELDCRSSARMGNMGGYDVYIGFRLARTP